MGYRARVNTGQLLVFGFVYLGMILGEIPGLALDRSGVALLGALALVAAREVSPEVAWQAMDVPTLALLFGLMVVSAQFKLGGFYARLTRRIASVECSPGGLLALIVAAAGLLSALLANDIVCLAMAPLVVDGCARRTLDPVPFLLGLACAANVGSAATLIGNPQNMLIGQRLGLPFMRHLLDAGVPAILGLVVVWWVVYRAWRGAWHVSTPVPRLEETRFDSWQTGKGVVVLVALVIAFGIGHWPRDVLALAAAGILLLSRRTASRDIIGQVDWHLLVLFVGLFVVNHALQASGTVDLALSRLAGAGLDLTRPLVLFFTTVVLSNLVSNVPAVMLLLPAASHPQAGAILALASTLAGNLFLVGSIANIIVVEQARALSVRIDWRTHARVGVPVTGLTLALAAWWLVVRAAFFSH
jgi:Na+/H+ antiporter NhaD/arsenite permease-like protein